MKKIYLINANAKKESLKAPYVNAYIEEAEINGNVVKTVNIYDLDVDFLSFDGNEIVNELSQDLKHVQQNILWADQIVLVYPIWCMAMPAKLKALLERVFQDGVLLEMTERGPVPLLKNKTMVVIQSYTMPVFYMKYFCGDLPFKFLKIVMDQWCGFKIEKRFDFGCIEYASNNKKKKWESSIRKFASRIK